MAANNKVIYGNGTIMDISDSTTSSNNLLNGAIGYSGTGDRVVGSLIPATPDDLDKAELNIWNLVRPPYTSEGGQLSTGITATINSDGSVTFNGTSSGDTTFWFKGDGDSIYLPKRTSNYLFKCCPDGGSINTYCANVLVYSGGSFVPIAINTNHQGISVSTKNGDRNIYINAVIKDGTTVSDLTFNAPSILPIVPADGHVILNDNGTQLTQRDELQAKGVYTHDDSTNGKTVIEVVREFNSVSGIEALTGESAKGFQYLDDDVYDSFTAGDIGFDNSDTSFTGNDVQEVLEEVDNKFDSPIDIKKTQSATAVLSVGGTMQLNSDIMGCKVIILTVGRYGYGDTKVFPVSRITDGAFTEGCTFWSDNAGAWVFKISTTGLITYKTQVGGVGEPYIVAFGI